MNDPGVRVRAIKHTIEREMMANTYGLTQREYADAMRELSEWCAAEAEMADWQADLQEGREEDTLNYD